MKKVKQEILEEFKVGEKDLYVSGRGKENPARLMAIGLLRECSGMTYKQIGREFGINSYKSVAKYVERIKGRCRQDKKLKAIFERLRTRCSQVETLPPS